MFNVKMGELFALAHPTIGEASKPKHIDAPTTILNTEIPTLETQPQFKSPPLRALGIKPNAPTLYYDIDMKYLNQENDDIINIETQERLKPIFDSYCISYNEAISHIINIKNPMEQLRAYIQYQRKKIFYAQLSWDDYHWAIYMTKDGFHYIHQMPTWDRVQVSLYELKYIYPRSSYFLNCRALRLRISPKWHKTETDVYGQPLVVSHMPILYDHCKCDIWSQYHNPDWDIRGLINNPYYIESYATYD